MAVSGVRAGSTGVTQAGVVAVCIWFLSFFIGMEGVFIGMEKVCLLACRRCVYWHGEGAFIGIEGCVCWHGGGVFIGMEEVRLLGWRCVYWHGGGVFIGVEEVCFLAWRRCVI